MFPDLLMAIVIASPPDPRERGGTESDPPLRRVGGLNRHRQGEDDRSGEQFNPKRIKNENKKSCEHCSSEHAA